MGYTFIYKLFNLITVIAYPVKTVKSTLYQLLKTWFHHLHYPCIYFFVHTDARFFHRDIGNSSCGQYGYQIPVSYSLQRAGHIEHLCLWLILIGRACPRQRWKIHKFYVKSSVQTHYSAMKSNIGSGNKLQVVSCLQSYFLSNLSFCGKPHITACICVTGSKASCWCLRESLSKTGPLRLGSENQFPLNFAHEYILVQK